MRTGHTLIVLVLDKSGSMAAVRDATISAFNEFLRDQKAQPGTAEIAVTLFDYTADIHAPVPLESAPLLGSDLLPYLPSGGTALLDAVGATINSIGARLHAASEDQRAERVLFVIQTDGEENQSKEFTAERVRGMIQHQRDTYGWAFLFLGADQDAWNAGANIGIGRAQTVSYNNTAAGTGMMTNSLSRSAGAYRTSGVAEFTAEEQDQREQKP